MIERLQSRLIFVSFLVVIPLLTLGQRVKFKEFQSDLKADIQRLDFDAGLARLDESEKIQETNHRLVYFMEKGAMLHYQGKYEESNEWFAKADYYVEDYYKQTGEVVLTYLTNPNSADYPGEDFEALFINYYKALNYIALGKLEEARVEARRMDNQLRWFNDKYPDNKYDKDAYIHLVMGMIYEANEEYNDACIAYKNAYQIYNDEYSKDYGFKAPDQLVIDIVRTARKAGLLEDVETYSAKLSGEQVQESGKNGLFVLWHNGLAPEKEGQNIEFAVVNIGGYISFHDNSNNEEYKFAESTVKSMAVINSLMGGGSGQYKMAFSKYKARKPKYQTAQVFVDGSAEPIGFNKCEDINAIAFQSHQDRKTRQFNDALIRLVVRETGKTAAKKGFRSLMKMGLQAAGAGDLADAAGTVSDLAIDGAMNSLEKADLRQWSSLPHSIYYTRISLEDGEHKLTFQAEGVGKHEEEIDVWVKGGQTKFAFVHTLDHSGYEVTPGQAAIAAASLAAGSAGSAAYNDAAMKGLANAIALGAAGSGLSAAPMSPQMMKHNAAIEESVKEYSAKSSEQAERDKFYSKIEINRLGMHPDNVEAEDEVKKALPGKYPVLGFLPGKRGKLSIKEKKRRELLLKEHRDGQLSDADQKKMRKYEEDIIEQYDYLRKESKEPENKGRTKYYTSLGVYGAYN